MGLTRFLGLIATTALLAFGGSTARAETGTQVLGYRLYAGGLHALDAQINTQDATDRYDMLLTSSTSSGFRLVAPWSGSFSVSGWFLDGKRQPETYKSISKGSDKLKEKTYTYNKTSQLVSFKSLENNQDKTPTEIAAELTPAGITDVLSATLEATDRVNEGKPCTGSSLIFDGDRSFTLAFKDAGEQRLEAGKFNVFEGTAKVCTFEMQPGKGKWRKKLRGWLMLQDQAKKLESEPTVYFGKPDPKGPYVPVKVQVKTNYGILLLHLSSYKGTDGTTIQAPVKKTD